MGSLTADLWCYDNDESTSNFILNASVDARADN